MIQLLSKTSNWKFILPFFLLFCFFTFYLFPSYQTKLTKIAGEELPPLDTRFSYSLQDVKYLFDKFGTEGRELYTIVAGRVDMIYPIIYGVLLILILAFLSRKVFGLYSKWILISLLPIIGMLFDFLENFNTLQLLNQYPELQQQSVSIGEQFTRVKHIALFTCVGLVLILTTALIVKSISKKNNK